eukprot:Tbor_TRINITY_DN5979_c3_g1::TRINITY_DN5979_c3_g1_i3::g.18573::m.18573
MKIFQYAVLLLVQLSPIFVLGNGEAVPEYKCTQEETNNVTVKDASAQLTVGCVLKGKEITFDLKAMYEAAARKDPKPSAVVIDITQASFTDSYVKLINADEITGDITTQIPLLFTVNKSKMTGTSNLEFGTVDHLFVLPPHSRITIIDSELTISTENDHEIFTFHSLQLITGSSIDITRNVITMECKKNAVSSVFVATGTIIISDKSSFTLRDNKITLHAHEGHNFEQYVWYRKPNSLLTISEGSTYKWISNIISLVGYDVTDQLRQYVWSQNSASPLEISKNSIFTWTSNIISMKGYTVAHWQLQYVWFQSRSSFIALTENSTFTLESNNISMVGYGIGKDGLQQILWYQESTAPLTIRGSKYTWLKNIISMDAHNITNNFQYMWYATSQITISAVGHFLFDTNKILMLAKGYGSIDSYVFRISISATSTISGGSKMEWKDNRVGMGHKKTDKGHVLGGMWSITDKSELLWSGNYITTTDEYQLSEGEGVTELVWGSKQHTAMTITAGSKLTIKDIQVYTNNGNGVAGSTLWKGSLVTSDKSLPPIVWSTTPAKDSRGTLMPTRDNNNLQEYWK